MKVLQAGQTQGFILTDVFPVAIDFHFFLQAYCLKVKEMDDEEYESVVSHMITT